MTRLFVRLTVLCLALTYWPQTAQTQETGRFISDWNEAILAIAEAEDGFLTLKGVRAAAMMHIAMHDALNIEGGQYELFLQHDRVPGADPTVAAIEAAFQIARDQYPQHMDALIAIRDDGLIHFPDSASRSAAIDLGQNIAIAILEARDSDKWNNEAEYQWHPMGPGVYAEFAEHSNTPEGFIFGAGWAKVKGFALESPEQFRSAPPPAINSDQYSEAFNEVKNVGRFQSMTRTPEQTHQALWWKDFAENSHNRLARDLVAQENLETLTTARLFALLNMSIFDAYISVFDNKFHFNHWRPYTAIRWAENDGNPNTIADPTWVNTHRHTYAFPSYPSAHGTACTAAMTVLADTFDEEFDFSMRTETVNVAGPFSEEIRLHPTTRHFSSFSDAGMECALSRIYLGIHFRYDSTAGFNLGQQVGGNVLSMKLNRKENSPR